MNKGHIKCSLSFWYIFFRSFDFFPDVHLRGCMSTLHMETLHWCAQSLCRQQAERLSTRGSSSSSWTTAQRVAMWLFFITALLESCGGTRPENWFVKGKVKGTSGPGAPLERVLMAFTWILWGRSLLGKAGMDEVESPDLSYLSSKAENFSSLLLAALSSQVWSSLKVSGMRQDHHHGVAWNKKEDWMYKLHLSSLQWNKCGRMCLYGSFKGKLHLFWSVIYITLWISVQIYKQWMLWSFYHKTYTEDFCNHIYISFLSAELIQLGISWERGREVPWGPPFVREK